ncbi:peptide/nickel transport system permease protein [Pullulanibacillus pueri]|uniref:ABC transmembrane type-1 domain-containing protein n=1 Tax=Pullulanibacillus pueri TaxID=1437324 RepID=A0A8J3A0P5_9BACL|nr:ABC transporter permease subunit [Pullulanibacillus pueri]MBM7682038.1 peptide/nickel transport system permease protein [Pullulanibacillus pueri]GGH88294.1 hypothetical protein GCM10007096_40300 [Pullulanibacillus pueri]
MTGFVTKSGAKFILTAIIIIFAGSLPKLFVGISFDFSAYLKEIHNVLSAMIHPSELFFYTQPEVTKPIFPYLWHPFFYSMKIFFGSFLLALLIGLIFSYFTFFLPRRLRKVISAIVFIGESLPDLFVIITIQLLIVWFYKQTHILLANVGGMGDHYVYLLPIICLAILPSFLFYRVILLACEDELGKDYIDMARSKGIRLPALLIRHVLRNMLTSIFFHSKTIIWMLLSNLLVFEYLFNIRGITMFMYEYPEPLIFTICMLMIFVPIFLFFMIVQLLIQWFTGQRVVV